MAYATNPSFAVVGATDTTLLGVNQSRRSLTISPPSAGRVTLAFGAAAVIDQGQTIYAGSRPITWTIDDVGDRLTGEIHAIADAPGRTVGILEAFEPRG